MNIDQAGPPRRPLKSQTVTVGRASIVAADGAQIDVSNLRIPADFIRNATYGRDGVSLSIDPPPLVFRISYRSILQIAGGAAFFIGLCLLNVWLADTPTGQWVWGSLAAILCGIPLIGLAWRLRGPVLIFDGAGITFHRGNVGLIPWSDIQRVTFSGTGLMSQMSIHVNDPAPYLHRMPKWRQRMAGLNERTGYAPLTTGIGGFAPDMRLAWLYLRLCHPSKL